MNGIPTILKDLRKNRNLTQFQLSQALKIGQATIAGYENGSREPHINSLIAYANFKEQYEVISHKNHLLYREVLTAFGDHPCCLSLLYHMRKFLSRKNGAASGVVFSCRSALLQTAGRGIRYLSAFPAASP